jgi:hypothetical protein
MNAQIQDRSDIADYPAWLTTLRRFMAVIVPGNLVWETAQLPLYTIWRKGSWSEISFAVLHCTAGDVLIAGASLFGALLLLGSARWPNDRYLAVAMFTILAGIAYTVLSEWLNTQVRASWTYSEFMPTLPVTGTGLSPLAQWTVIPLAAFWWARRHTLNNPLVNGPSS